MQEYPPPKVLAQVTARVRERLPDVADDVIDAQVAMLFADYADSRVRDFVPVLVERQTVEHLRPLRRRTDG